MRIMDAVKEAIAEFRALALRRFDEGLTLETSAIHGVHYPHQHTLHAPVCLPMRGRRAGATTGISMHHRRLDVQTFQLS